MTYDELVARIKKFAETDDAEDFNPSIQGFVSAAEDRIAKNLDIEAEVANEISTATIGVGQRFISRPAASKGIYQFRMSETVSGPWFHLLLRDRSYCDDFAPHKAIVGKPRYYCIYNQDTLLVVPSLDRPYYGEISHQVFVTGLGPGKQTTWISLNAEELLFEAVMVKVAEFQKKPERAAMHEQMFTSMLDAERGQAIRQMRDKLRIV